MSCACGCGKPARPRGRYASAACRARDWKRRTGYGPPAAVRTRERRRESRDGRGVRLYITEDEARALADYRLPITVAEKVRAKLKPPAPMPGQTNIYDCLEDPCPRP